MGFSFLSLVSSDCFFNASFYYIFFLLIKKKKKKEKSGMLVFSYIPLFLLFVVAYYLL